MSINRHIDRYEEEDKDHVKHVTERVRMEFIEDDCFYERKHSIIQTTFIAHLRAIMITGSYFSLILLLTKLLEKF